MPDPISGSVLQPTFHITVEAPAQASHCAEKYSDLAAAEIVPWTRDPYDPWAGHQPIQQRIVVLLRLRFCPKILDFTCEVVAKDAKDLAEMML